MPETKAIHAELRPRGRLDFYQDDSRFEDRGDPRRRIRRVAIVLLILNTLSLLGVMGFLIEMMRQWNNMAPEEAIASAVALGLMALLHVISILGLVSALTLRSYVWAWVGVGLSVVPCGNLLALAWLPLLASAWGLFCLLDPEVRQAFRK